MVLLLESRPSQLEVHTISVQEEQHQESPATRSLSSIVREKLPFTEMHPDSAYPSQRPPAEIPDRRPPTRCFLDQISSEAMGYLQEYHNKLPVPEIIANEERFKDSHTPLYTAFNKTVYLIQIFTAQLMLMTGTNFDSKRRIEDITWVRNPLANHRLKRIPANTEDFYTLYGDAAIDNRSSVSWNVISCNAHLFGNTLKAAEESTVDYWWDDSSVQPPQIGDIVRESLSTLGICTDAEDHDKLNTFIAALISTLKLIESAHGVLFQIFIPHEEVNRIAFICGANGIPDLDHPDTLDTLTKIQQPSEVSKVINYMTMQVRLLAGRFINLDLETRYPVIQYHEFSEEKNRAFKQKVGKLIQELIIGSPFQPRFETIA